MTTMEGYYLAFVIVLFVLFCLGLSWGMHKTRDLPRSKSGR